MLCASILFQLLVSLLWLLSVYVESTPHAPQALPKFAPWGEACRMYDSKKEGIIPIHETCDQSKGMSCQKYQQGVYCGCQVSGVLTYDQSSKECRVKVGQSCHPYDPKSDIYKQLSFNIKCHEHADCKPVDIPNAKGKKSEPLCVCKPGYITSKDLTQCNDPNSANSSQISNKILCGLALLFTLLFKELF